MSRDETFRSLWRASQPTTVEKGSELQAIACAIAVFVIVFVLFAQ